MDGRPVHGAHPCLPTAAHRERALRIAVAGGDEVLVLPRMGVEDRERPEAAPLLRRLDDGDRDAVEALIFHRGVEVAHVADRAPHDVEQTLHEAGERAEAARVRQLARDRREQIDLARLEREAVVERDVPGEATVDVPVAAKANGREEERDRVSGARERAQLAGIGAVVLGPHLAAAAREIQYDDMEIERARVDLREVHVLLDRRRQAIHREEREAEDRVLPEARGDDARERAESAPGARELLDAAGRIRTRVDDADRAGDDDVGGDALLLEVAERADVVRPERRPAAEDEDASARRHRTPS